MTDTVTAPSEDDAALLADVSTWLADNWDPDLTVAEWWELVGAAGWSAPHFPREWGGLGYARRSVVATRAAFQRHGAVQPPAGLGMLMAAPTICTHGTDEQITRLVAPIYNGSVAWCQLFSEPGAGSDLAGLSTRATRDGDHWVISGQKVWSSMAMGADYGMLLAARTPMSRSMRVSRGSRSRSTNRASPSARSSRSPGTRCSTRCSSTTR